MKYKVPHYKPTTKGTKEQIYKEINSDMYCYMSALEVALSNKREDMITMYQLLIAETLSYAKVIGFPLDEKWEEVVEIIDKNMTSLMTNCAEIGCKYYENQVLLEWNKYFDKKCWFVLANTNHVFYAGINIIEAIHVYLHTMKMNILRRLGIKKCKNENIKSFVLLHGIKKVEKYTGISKGSIKECLANINDPYKVVFLEEKND